MLMKLLAKYNGHGPSTVNAAVIPGLPENIGNNGNLTMSKYQK